MKFVFVYSHKARTLLLQYSGYTKDHKHLKEPKELTMLEFKELHQFLTSDFRTLSKLLNILRMATRKKCSPTEYRRSFSELARNSTACGIFQVSEESNVYDYIVVVVNGSIDLFKSSSQLFALQNATPILVEFVRNSKMDTRGRPSEELCDALSHIAKVFRAPFLNHLPQIFSVLL